MHSGREGKRLQTFKWPETGRFRFSELVAQFCSYRKNVRHIGFGLVGIRLSAQTGHFRAMG